MLSVTGAGHGFADLLRAVFEGMSFAARDCYEAMGAIPKEIRVTGGGARSNAMRAILASILNAQIRSVDREEAGACGAAMMAAVQQNIYPSMADCVANWVDKKLGNLTSPDDGLTEVYDNAFKSYVVTRIKMQPTWRMKSELFNGIEHISIH